jgi:uncharacterized protein
VTSPKGSPVSASERVVALDAVRGIALFGVLIENVLMQFRVSQFEQFLPLTERLTPRGGTSPADHLVARATEVGLEYKSIALFSLLFGVGLAAQQERIAAKGTTFARYVSRRLAFLFVLGVAHMFLVWNGDILTLYAIVGVLAALFMRLPSRALLLLAAGLFVVQALPLPYPTPFASYAQMHQHVMLARRVYGFGGFADVLAFRVHEVRPVAALLFWIVPRTLALFVLGAWAWRARLFEGKRPATLRAIAALGIAAGIAIALAETLGVGLGRYADAIRSTCAVLLAFAYAAIVVLGFAEPRARRVLSIFAPLGRMALTSYLTQSVVLGAIFYGYGLGLFDRLGEARAAAIGVALYVAQIVVSTLWLRHFRFGPVEWLWRCCTYGAMQPMRR